METLGCLDDLEAGPTGDLCRAVAGEAAEQRCGNGWAPTTQVGLYNDVNFLSLRVPTVQGWPP